MGNLFIDIRHEMIWKVWLIIVMIVMTGWCGQWGRDYHGTKVSSGSETHILISFEGIVPESGY